MPITREDLRAQGLHFDEKTGLVTRREDGHSETAPRITLLGIDPSLKNLGIAAVCPTRKTAESWYHGITSSLRKGEGEAAFLTRRLVTIMQAVRGRMVEARKHGQPITAIIEGAKPLHGRRVSKDALPKLGTAVGVAWASAAMLGGETLWVRPDMTWDVLCGRPKGGAAKGERWVRAIAVLAAHGIEWPLPPAHEIDERNPESHQADALSLCAAWLVSNRELRDGL